MTMHRGTIRAASTVLLGALALTALAVPVAQAADPAPCRVRNVTQEKASGSFRSMVGAARDGDRLTVRGTCEGGVTIRTDLAIRGVGDPRPVLTGRDRHRVLSVGRTATVVLAPGHHAGMGGTVRHGWRHRQRGDPEHPRLGRPGQPSAQRRRHPQRGHDDAHGLGRAGQLGG